MARCCKDATFSEMTDSEIAESCTIPPRGHGVVLNARVKNEEAMRVVHEILCTFGPPPTEKDQNTADNSCRLVSIGISNVVETRPSRLPEASSHI